MRDERWDCRKSGAKAGLLRFPPQLRPDGSVDPSFNSDPLPGPIITQVIALPDGRVAVIGHLDLQPVSGTQQRGYVLLLDATGRQVWQKITNDLPSWLALADDGTGDMYLGGAFTRYDNQTMQRIARLNSDGSAD